MYKPRGASGRFPDAFDKHFTIPPEKKQVFFQKNVARAKFPGANLFFRLLLAGH
jgi:hypothetical protein